MAIQKQCRNNVATLCAKNRCCEFELVYIFSSLFRQYTFRLLLRYSEIGFQGVTQLLYGNNYDGVLRVFTKPW